MSHLDATSKLNRFEKRQLAFVLYTNIPVDSQVVDPETGQQLSPALLSSGMTLSKRLCSRHERLNGDLVEHLLNLIKCEVGARIDIYFKHHKGLAETKQKLVNDLRQLNNMWMKDARFAKEYFDPTGEWPYQKDRCEACIVGRVAQNATTLRNLHTFLEARAPPREDHVPPPRLLFWVTRFLYCHENKVSPIDGENYTLSRSKSMHQTPAEPAPKLKTKPDWTEATMATIERWQQLEAATATTIHESHSDHDLNCYTPTKITRSLTLGRMENHKRPTRAHQQPRRTPNYDTSNFDISNRDHGHGTSNRPRTLDNVSHDYNQRGNPPYPNSDILVGLSTVGANRYNDVPFSPTTSITRAAATAVGIAAGSTIEGAGSYGRNGNFDTDLEPEPDLELDLEHQPDTDIDTNINNGRDSNTANDFGESNATKMEMELDVDFPRTPEDPDSEWDDDSVYDSDERHFHAGDVHGHMYDIASRRRSRFDSMGLDPMQELGGMVAPKLVASRASVLTTWHGLFEERKE